jgi:hypothetical protein
MVGIQIQLTEPQVRSLKKMANEYQVSMADLIRRSIDNFINTSCRMDNEERKRRAIAASGRFQSGKNDVSINHDRYLSEDIM